MDEFDKIREISEDLTHRREPTFTQFSQLTTPSAAVSPTPSVTNTPYASAQNEQVQRINSFLSQPVASLNESDKPYAFTGNFSDKIDFIQSDNIEEKHFSSMKLHIIGISVFAGILGIILAGFFFFNGESDGVDEVVTITTAPAVVKDSPTQAGGINIPDQDKLVYNRIRSGNVTTKVESLFPEPEKPVMPQILAIEEEEPEESFVSMKNVQAVNPLNEPAQPIAAVKEQPVAQKNVQSAETVKTVQSKTGISESVQPQPSVVPLPKEKPVEKQVTQQAKQPTIQEAKQSGNIWRVQLFATNNKEAVEKAWKRISATHKSLLSNMSYTIEPAEIKGKGTFYRLKVGQFATRDMATALCAKLKAQKQDCVATK